MIICHALTRSADVEDLVSVILLVFIVDNFDSNQPTLGGVLSWVGERLSIQIVSLYVQIPLVRLMVQLHLLPSTCQ